MDQCNHAVKGEWPSHSPTNTIWCRPIKAFSLWDRCLLVSTCQWMGICTLAFLTPQMNIVSNNQTLTVPLTAHPWSKRAIQFISLLVSLGITAGIGMGIGRIASSTTFYHTLSRDFTDNIERVAKSLVAFQDQLDSLDLLPAEKGGLCLFLNEGAAFM